MEIKEATPTSEIVDDIFDSDFGEELPDFEEQVKEKGKSLEDVLAEVETPTIDEKTDEETEVEPKVKEKEKKDEKNLTKKVSIRVGDKDVEVDEDSTVKVKVDGKLEAIPIKEALANYSGKVAWEKRFNEVAKLRKEVESEKKSIDTDKSKTQELVNTLHNGLAQGDLFGVVSGLLDMAGLSSKVSAQDYVRDLRKSLLQHAQQISSMTPEQLEMIELREARDYDRKRLDSLAKQREREQAEMALKRREAELLKQNAISEEEYEELREQVSGIIRANGGDPEKIVTPEFLVQHKKSVADYRTVQEIASEIDPSILQRQWDDKTSIWDHLVQLMRSGWSKQDLAEAITGATKKARAVSVSKKVAKVPNAAPAKKQAASSAGIPKIDFSKISEDDFNW